MIGPRELATATRLELAASDLASRTVELQQLTWVKGLDAEVRASIGLVVHAGISEFVAWLRDPKSVPASGGHALAAAPRAVTRTVSLANALDLFRATVAALEEAADTIAVPGTAAWLKERMLVYSREVAYAIAGVYATAAEERGGWDARQQALVIDGLLTGEGPESLTLRAGALGWSDAAPVIVVAARRPTAGLDDPATQLEQDMDEVQRMARRGGLSAIAGVRGDNLVVALGGVDDPIKTVTALFGQLGDVPVVVSPSVPDVGSAGPAARAAVSGLAVVASWPDAPRPVLAQELLPERALAGDAAALADLVDTVHAPLEAAGQTLLPTLACYLEQAGSLEDCARRMFVHVNTVRYRLGQIMAITGHNPTNPRGSFVLRAGLIAGRLGRPL